MWELLAMITAPTLVFSLLLILPTAINVSDMISPLRAASTAHECLAARLNLSAIADQDEHARVELEALSAFIDSERITAQPAALAVQRFRSLVATTSKPGWEYRLHRFTLDERESLRSRIHSCSYEDIWREQRVARRAARARRAMFAIRTLAYPAYRELVNRSARVSLPLGAMALFAAALSWFLVSMTGQRLDFISTTGNLTAFAALLALLGPSSAEFYRQVYPSSVDNDSTGAQNSRLERAASNGLVHTR